LSDLNPEIQRSQGMTNTERFEESKRIWSETLTPASPVERRLVNFIACQDWLLYRSMLRAIAADGSHKALQYEIHQRQLADSIECLIQAVTALQKRRLGARPEPPPEAGAKVIEMPRRRTRAAKHWGRPRAIELDLDPLPALEPFGPRRAALSEDRPPRARPVLDFPRAA
jgi:hypothetical protein